MPRMSLQRLKRAMPKQKPAQANNHAKHEPAEAKSMYTSLVWNLQRDNSFSLGSGRYSLSRLSWVRCSVRVLQRRQFFNEGVIDFLQVIVNLLLATLA